MSTWKINIPLNEETYNRLKELFPLCTVESIVIDTGNETLEIILEEKE